MMKSNEMCFDYFVPGESYADISAWCYY